MPEDFKIGDKVEVCNYIDVWNGIRGIITEITRWSSGNLVMSIAPLNGKTFFTSDGLFMGNSAGFYANHLKLIGAPASPRNKLRFRFNGETMEVDINHEDFKTKDRRREAPAKAMTDIEFVEYLKTLPGAIPYDGDASVQVVFKLANGMNLRIGVTDDDCTDQLGLWADNYGGLAIVGGDRIS